MHRVLAGPFMHGLPCGDFVTQTPSILQLCHLFRPWRGSLPASGWEKERELRIAWEILIGHPESYSSLPLHSGSVGYNSLPGRLGNVVQLLVHEEEVLTSTQPQVPQVLTGANQRASLSPELVCSAASLRACCL